MEHEVPKAYWRIQDVFVAGITVIFLNLAFGTVVGRNGLQLPYLASAAMTVMINLTPVLLLCNRYPLRIYSWTNPAEILRVVAVGTGVCIVLNYPYIIWKGDLGVMQQTYRLFVGHGTYERILIFAVLCMVLPISEELLFRGIIYRIVRKRYDIFWGLLVSSILNAVYYDPSLDPDGLLYCFLVASVYALVYEKSKTILASVLTSTLHTTLWCLLVLYHSS